MEELDLNTQDTDIEEEPSILVPTIEELAESEHLLNLEIIKYPDKRLKLSSVSVLDFEENRDELIKNLLYTMKVNGGVSIAAPSVGIMIRLAIFNIGSPVIMFNPMLTSHSKEVVELEEGVISIPGFFYNIKRYKEIEFVYQNELGEHIHSKANGLLAACIQHEMDILNGKLYLDKISKVKKFFELKKIKKHIKKR